jgi:hypothetical protein
MLILFYIAVFAGIMLYVTKLISFYAMLSPFPRFKKWMIASPFRLAVIDLVFGYLGMHVISIAAGSVSAMMIMIVFGTCSIIYLSLMSLKIKWIQRKERQRLSGALPC